MCVSGLVYFLKGKKVPSTTFSWPLILLLYYLFWFGLMVSMSGNGRFWNICSFCKLLVVDSFVLANDRFVIIKRANGTTERKTMAKR